MVLWRDFSKLQYFKTKTKKKPEICFECYQIHQTTTPTSRWSKELSFCSGMALASLFTEGAGDRELLFLCKRNYWRSLTFLKILFDIWKSTSPSIKKHDKMVLELIRLRVIYFYIFFKVTRQYLHITQPTSPGRSFELMKSIVNEK